MGLNPVWGFNNKTCEGIKMKQHKTPMSAFEAHYKYAELRRAWVSYLRNKARIAVREYNAAKKKH